MKEINAILRINKVQKVKEALAQGGYHSITLHQVMGRGKQRGLLYDFTKYCDEGDEPKAPTSQLLAKRMLIITVEDESMEEVVQIIMTSAKTGEIGDGKIFVMPVGKVVRIRTGETNNDALL